MNNIEGLNNREISFAIWLGAILLYTVYKARSFKFITRLVRAFLAWKVLTMYLASTLYTCSAVYLLHKLDWWSIAQLKDTILWCTLTILKTLLNLSDVRENKNYLREALLDNLKITLLVEFITETYTFSLPVELILVPLLFLLGGIQAVASHDKKYSNTVPVLQNLVILFGLAMFMHSIWRLINTHGYADLDKWREFTLSPILAIWFLPWLYFLVMMMAFETALTSLKIKLQEKGLYRIARKKAVRAFLFDPAGLKRWFKMLFLKDINTKAELETSIKEIKRLQRIEKKPPPVFSAE